MASINNTGLTYAEAKSTAHGSPFDRGSSDRYYGRPASPHKWLDLLGRERVDALTHAEAEEYWEGYITEEDHKDWGGE